MTVNVNIQTLDVFDSTVIQKNSIFCRFFYGQRDLSYLQLKDSRFRSFSFTMDNRAHLSQSSTKKRAIINTFLRVLTGTVHWRLPINGRSRCCDVLAERRASHVS